MCNGNKYLKIMPIASTDGKVQDHATQSQIVSRFIVLGCAGSIGLWEKILRIQIRMLNHATLARVKQTTFLLNGEHYEYDAPKLLLIHCL